MECARLVTSNHFFNIKIMSRFTNKARKELHHCIPVSICGPNYVENVVELTQSDHSLIHQTLDVSSNLIRTFRIRTNHLIMAPNEYFVRELMQLHHLYFARVYLLPERLIKVHAECMMNTTIRHRAESKLQPLEDCEHGTYIHMFNHWLIQYHDTLLELCKKEKE